MNRAENNPVPSSPPRASEAALLARVIDAADACFSDLLRQGRITPESGRTWRRAKADARAALAAHESPRVRTGMGGP
ncbi:MAG: hypothetical protein Q8M02_13320 [Candidatus Didemnitutus sp.]|nr:hypothetical protein [Candidatus Didemnitutus sp.]